MLNVSSLKWQLWQCSLIYFIKKRGETLNSLCIQSLSPARGACTQPQEMRRNLLVSGWLQTLQAANTPWQILLGFQDRCNTGHLQSAPQKWEGLFLMLGASCKCPCCKTPCQFLAWISGCTVFSQPLCGWKHCLPEEFSPGQSWDPLASTSLVLSS